MAFRLVSLLSTLLASTALGQMMGQSPFGAQTIGGLNQGFNQGFNTGFNNNGFGQSQMGNSYSQYGQTQQFVNPNMLTCMGGRGGSAMPIQGQGQGMGLGMRLTLTPLQRSQGSFGVSGGMGGGFPSSPLGGTFGGFPGMGGMGGRGLGASPFGGIGGAFGNENDDDELFDWMVDGYVYGAGMVNAGSYQMGVFEGGRTYTGCHPNALGQILTSISVGPLSGGMGQMGGMGGMGGMGLGHGMGGFGMPGMHGMGFGHMGGFGAMSPLNSLLGNLVGQQTPAGQVSNPVLMTQQGSTVYSGMLKGLSKNHLMSRGIAMCGSIQNGRCVTPTFCCTTARDQLPASENYQTPQEIMAAAAGVTGNMGAMQPGVVGVVANNDDF